MISVLIVIHTIISILLIAVILMQAGQGGGLAGGLSAGMGNSIFGGRAAATALSRITTWFAIAFMALGVLISLFSSPNVVENESILKREADERLLDLSAPDIQQNLEIE